MQTNHLCQAAIDQAATQQTVQLRYFEQVAAAKQRANALRDEAVAKVARAVSLWVLQGFERGLQQAELAVHRAIDALQPKRKAVP